MSFFFSFLVLICVNKFKNGVHTRFFSDAWFIFCLRASCIWYAFSFWIYYPDVCVYVCVCAKEKKNERKRQQNNKPTTHTHTQWLPCHILTANDDVFSLCIFFLMSAENSIWLVWNYYFFLFFFIHNTMNIENKWTLFLLPTKFVHFFLLLLLFQLLLLLHLRPTIIKNKNLNDYGNNNGPHNVYVCLCVFTNTYIYI